MVKTDYAVVPCPARVLSGGKWVYCEVGPKGHDGTHSGDRSRAEYLCLVRAASAEKDEG